MCAHTPLPFPVVAGGFAIGRSPSCSPCCSLCALGRGGKGSWGRSTAGEERRGAGRRGGEAEAGAGSSAYLELWRGGDSGLSAVPIACARLRPSSNALEKFGSMFCSLISLLSSATFWREESRRRDGERGTRKWNSKMLVGTLIPFLTSLSLRRNGKGTPLPPVRSG